MLLGYHTNGLSNHDPMDALKLLVDTGYKSVGINIDHAWLKPDAPSRNRQLEEIKYFLKEHSMASVVETSARFLLDPTTKHFPTLIEPYEDDCQKRIGFLKYCIDTAVELGSDCVSLWSGRKPHGTTVQQAMDRLATNLRIVLDHAEECQIDVALEPEPEMLIDTTGRFERLTCLVDSPRLKMTMDIGHLFCQSELPIAQYIEKWADRIVNVHVEDMQAGVHEHLMFGEGQIYFPPVMESLAGIGYKGGIHVELGRHSHLAADAVRDSFDFLNPIIEDAITSQGL